MLESIFGALALRVIDVTFGMALQELLIRRHAGSIPDHPLHPDPFKRN